MNILEKECLVLEKLVEAWNLFTELETQHPDELNDFKEGVHKCQSVIGLRFSRHYRPDVFPIKDKKREEVLECEEHFFNNIAFEFIGGTLYINKTCVNCRYKVSEVSNKKIERFEWNQH